MANLSKNRQKVMPAQVSYGGERIRFDYYPWFIGTKEYNEAATAARDDEGMEATYAFLCRVMKSWDLEADYIEEKKGAFRLATPEDDEATAQTRVIPLTVEALAEADIPIQLLVEIERKAAEETSNGGLQAKK